MKKPPNTNKIFFEKDLVQHLVGFLNSNGYRVRLEVSNMGQSADIVATKNRWITAIEAKLFKWRDALKQSVAHEHVADYICIAVTCTVTNMMKDDISKNGYGLIYCNPSTGDCSWIILPRLNNKVWMPQRRQFVKSFKEIQYAS